MQTTLAQFNETASTDAFALQNSYLLKVRLDQGAIRAKQGSMVAYQGDVTFEHAGAGGVSKFMKKALTGEGQDLMKVSGSGEVFLADTAQHVHLIKLEGGEQITLTGRNSGESVQMAFGGQGWVLVQPSEGRVGTQPASGGGGGALGNLLGG